MTVNLQSREAENRKKNPENMVIEGEGKQCPVAAEGSFMSEQRLSQFKVTLSISKSRGSSSVT